MSAESNATKSRRIMEEGFNLGDLDVVDELCAPDIVSHDPAEPDDVRGIDAHKERIGTYRKAMPDLEVTVEDLIASRDRVVTRWTVRGTNLGEFEGMQPTGRRIEISGISIDRFDDQGRIAETWDNWDNLGFMQQLGLVPEEAIQAQ